VNPRVHDLLEIDVQSFLAASPSAPQWVAKSLAAAPFVVVRRGFPTQRQLPIGVRGAERNQRWAGTCDLSWIRSVLTPAALMSRMRSDSMATQAIPALRSLVSLASNETWQAFSQPWGPGGSVGFELATGRDTATPQSDLDVVIYADERLSAQEAKCLLAATQHLASIVDVRVETPVCGFSLTEYASQTPAPILLRTASGPLLGADPWDGAPAASPP
jgi:phosphoribosyl-dephospho-CoA transferase